MSPIIIAPVVIADMVATTKMEATSRLHNEQLSNVTKPYGLRLPIRTDNTPDEVNKMTTEIQQNSGFGRFQTGRGLGVASQNNF